MTEILNGKDPLRRVTELSALLPTLGPTAVPALVEAFEAAPLDGGDPELVLLGMWWARFDPQAALAWTTTESARAVRHRDRGGHSQLGAR